MENKFYEFCQNNSGGSFEVNEKVCHRLFIEALSAEDANEKAGNLGVYFDGCDLGMDCECCGDRWSEAYEGSIIDLSEYSKSYNQDFKDIREVAQCLADMYGWTKPDCRIFYLNGSVDEVFSNKL